MKMKVGALIYSFKLYSCFKLAEDQFWMKTNVKNLMPMKSASSRAKMKRKLKALKSARDVFF